MAAGNLTASRLREVLEYNGETGVFTWRPRPLPGFSSLRACNAWNGRYRGKIAGGLGGPGRAYTSISIDGIHYWAHRLAVLFVTGEWPFGEVDHRHGLKSDNRYSELRDVPGTVNRQNIRKSPASKTSDLPLGVYRHTRLKKTPFSSSLAVNGKTIFLGYFATREAAHDAFVNAKRFHHAGCTI